MARAQIARLETMTPLIWVGLARPGRARWVGLLLTTLTTTAAVGAPPRAPTHKASTRPASIDARASGHGRAGATVTDTAGLAAAAFLSGAGVDLAAGRKPTSFISVGPPGLPPPPPPSWLRQWTVELRDALRYPKVDHALAHAPLHLLRLGTTTFGLRRGARVPWRELRCRPGDPGSLQVSLRWQGAKGDVLIGVDRRCQAAGGGTRWLRLVARCDSQGAVRHTFGLQLILKAGRSDYPLRLAPLGKGERAQIGLRGGGWLLQLDRGRQRRSAPGAPGAPGTRAGDVAARATKRAKADGGVSPRRLLLAIEPQGRNGTLLFDGPITALEAERGASRRAVETDLPPAKRMRGGALGGIWEAPFRNGGTVWLQALAQPGPRDAGMAAWRHTQRGWTRLALPLPRTHGEGSWLCQRADERLRCTFQTVPLPGVRGFEPRTFVETVSGWRETR